MFTFWYFFKIKNNLTLAKEKRGVDESYIFQSLYPYKVAETITLWLSQIKY